MSFSIQVVSAIQKDLLFAICHWSCEEVDTLLCPVKVYIEAAKFVRNRCDEALKLIDGEWGLRSEHYIRIKGFIKCILKLITTVANDRDILDLKRGLLFANI